MGKSKEVIKISFDNKEIEHYFNVREASIKNNISIDRIRKCIGKDKLLDGYKYVYSGNFSDVVDKSNWKYKCPYCNEIFETYNGLTKHVLNFKAHGIKTKEELLSDYAYNGERPKCKCGCGEYTNISFEGGAHFCDYKIGHSSRVNNNWGHNVNAINNSSETRREQYKNGDRIQWNKDKKWEDVYDNETINKLSSNLSDKLHNRVINNKFKLSSMLEDNFIEKYLSPLNINYKKQFYIKDINQYCDILLTDFNTIIEINGSYWHCDPRIYNKPINGIQKNKINKDIIKYKWLINNGYHIIVLWEYDIIKNPNEIKDKLFNYINNNNKTDWKEEVNNYISSFNCCINKNFYLIDLLKNSELYVKDNNLLDIYNSDSNSIIIFEDEWLYHSDIVKSRIKNILHSNSNRIYARKCEIKEIRFSDCKDFMNKNHIQGSVCGKYYIGLYYNNELVSLMTFGNLRKNLGYDNKDNTYELLRFCNKLNTTVIGGASKLFKYFITKYNPIEVISYCDKRWSRGNLYEQLGFTLIRESKPNYYYINNFLNKRENRFSYRKDLLVKDGFDECKTEREIMNQRMIYRIYDCGCKVYCFKNKK